MTIPVCSSSSASACARPRRKSSGRAVPNRARVVPPEPAVGTGKESPMSPAERLAMHPWLAALLGALLVIPFVALNAAVGHRLEPLVSVLRPGGHTGPVEYAVLAGVLVLLPIGAGVALLPLRGAPDGRRRSPAAELRPGGAARRGLRPDHRGAGPGDLPLRRPRPAQLRLRDGFIGPGLPHEVGCPRGWARNDLDDLLRRTSSGRPAHSAPPPIAVQRDRRPGVRGGRDRAARSRPPASASGWPGPAGTLREGKTRSLRHHLDVLTLLQQIGALPPP